MMFAVLEAGMIKGTVPLTHEAGMAGAIPVFSTEEAAQEYAAGKYRVMELHTRAQD